MCTLGLAEKFWCAFVHYTHEITVCGSGKCVSLSVMQEEMVKSHEPLPKLERVLYFASMFIYIYIFTAFYESTHL